MSDVFTFQPGDRVATLRTCHCFEGTLPSGSVGTAVGDRWGDGRIIQCKWDNFRAGHSCQGKLSGKDACSGWNVECDFLVFAEEAEPISIDVSEVL